LSQSSGFIFLKPTRLFQTHKPNKMSNLRIAVQKSGRLNEDSMALLKDIGISIDNGKDQLKASAKGFPVEVFY
jgi:ATP phosphoribosyltransferase